MAATAAHAAQDKLASNIAAIDVSDVLAITEVFVLASADNERQVGSIVDEVEDQMTAEGFEPQRREGNRENRWVLLDYGNIVIHVQRTDQREHCPSLHAEARVRNRVHSIRPCPVIHGHPRKAQQVISPFIIFHRDSLTQNCRCDKRKRIVPHV